MTIPPPPRPRPSRLPPSGRVSAGPRPPARWTRAVRPTVSLALLAVVAATATWSAAQVADRSRPPGARTPAHRPNPATPGHATPDPLPGRLPGPPPGTAARPATTEHPAEPSHRATGRRPGQASRPRAVTSPDHARDRGSSPRTPTAGRRPGAAPSRGSGWIEAQCARRFPDATRRRACVASLHRTLGR